VRQGKPLQALAVAQVGIDVELSHFSLLPGFTGVDVCASCELRERNQLHRIDLTAVVQAAQHSNRFVVLNARLAIVFLLAEDPKCLAYST
ncbi:hypothetical protein JTM08_34575, partial [Pseudomonas aeruginosa]|nr:hypothetical protein [Pseudomonas aeruginosa]